MKGDRILICAKEAGSSALIAEFLQRSLKTSSKRKNNRIKILASRAAFPSFSQFQQVQMVRVEEMSTEPSQFKMLAKKLLSVEQPNLVLLGTSLGPSLEKQLLLAAKTMNVPVHCYVDHYWNSWQRFAHERTAKKWHYLPDRIVVIDRRIKKKLTSSGCPEEIIRVKHHPLLQKRKKLTPAWTGKKVRETLEISDKKPIFLFASENIYQYQKKWQLEEPLLSDLKSLLKEMIIFAKKKKLTNPTSHPVIVIKLHPAERRSWKTFLKGVDTEIFRVVREIEKNSLIAASRAIFGLQSMLLMEAAQNGKMVFSFHKSKKDPESWLSFIFPRIKEIPTEMDLAKLLESLS